MKKFAIALIILVFTFIFTARFVEADINSEASSDNQYVTSEIARDQLECLAYCTIEPRIFEGGGVSVQCDVTLCNNSENNQCVLSAKEINNCLML